MTDINGKGVKLVLQDGSVFEGFAFGSKKDVAGEVVFNTGMVGYPETLTDPTYRGQILTLTYPLIGNYGVPSNDKENNMLKHFESDHIQIKGLIISDYSQNHSHWNSAKSLDQWLKEHGVPGIYGIDTRELTKKLREHGVMLGKIVVGEDINFEDPNMRNLVDEVSVKDKVIYQRGPIKILVIDTGCKNNIIRCFLDRDITVIRVPWDYDFADEEYDGLFISNGPGDPKHCKKTVLHIREAMKNNKPIFGICLGNQLIGLAAGADTYKLKYGHRSQNQPCLEVGTKRCYITSQNHGYALDDTKLPKDWEVWFRNLNDNTNEGIRHKSKPFFSVQFHPEATPGPVDTEFLFDRFIEEVKKRKLKKK